VQDRDVIRERVERLRRHAEQLLDDMAGSVARTRLEMAEAETENNLRQEGGGGNIAGSSSRRPPKSAEEMRQDRARLQQKADEKKSKVCVGGGGEGGLIRGGRSHAQVMTHMHRLYAQVCTF